MTPVALDTTKLIEICRRNDVSMLGVFGSVARGEMSAESDIDLLFLLPDKQTPRGQSVVEAVDRGSRSSMG